MSNLSEYGIKRKVWISILLGILSLVFSPYTFNLTLGEVVIHMPWSILFSLLAAMTFGWKFGLLAGLCGGAFFPFLLWANNGWANLFTVILYLVFYAITGLLHDMNYVRRIYQLPARLLLLIGVCTIITYVYFGFLFNLLLGLNPPFWYVHSVKSLPQNVLFSIAFKDIFDLVYLIFIAETLIMLPLFRRLLGIPTNKEYRANLGIFVITIMAFFIIWLSFIGLSMALLKGPDALHPEPIALSFLVILSSGFLTARVLMYFNLTQINIQARLNKSEEKYKALFENLNDAVLVLRDGVFIECNAKALDLFGCSLHNIIGKTPEFYSPLLQTNGSNSKEKYEERINRALLNEPQKFEWLHNRFDGSRFDAEISLTRLYINNESFLQVIVRDITENKIAEKELIESRVLMTSIVDSTSDLIWSFDPETFRLLSFNQAYREHFFHTRGIAVKIGLLPEDLLPAEYAKVWREWYKEALVKSPFTREYVTHDGSRILDLSFNAMKREGVIFGISVFGKDITLRKKSDEALLESEMKYSRIVNTANEGVMMVDENSLITYVNAQLCEMMGYLPEEMVNHSIENFVYESEITDHKHKVAQRKRGISDKFERRFTKKDGTIIWLLISATAIKDKENKAIGSFAMLNDITERKLAEQKLKQSEERFRNLSDLLPQGVFETDSGGNLTYVNNFAHTLFGYNETDISNGLNVFDLLIPEDAEIARGKMKRIIFENGTAKSEYMALKKDGTKFPIIVYSNAIINHSQFIGLRSIIFDISELKQAEIALRESEARLRAIFENSRDAIRVSKNGVHILANPSYLTLFGFDSNNKVIGTSIIDRIAPSQREEMKQYVAKISAREAIPNFFEVRGIHADGTEFDAEFNVSSYDLNGEVYSLSTIRDITARKLAEEELRKLSRAVEQSPANIIITNTLGEIEYVNPSFTEVTGYSLDEVKGKNPRILKSGYTPKEEYKELWEKISGGNDWRGEFLNRKKNGELYWETVSISPVINDLGAITHYVAVKEDITERKETDRRILHAIIEAEENERHRFSRDLHDGLGPIIGTIKLYFQWLAENTNPQQKANIAAKGNYSINEAIQSIRDISNNLSPRVLSNLGIVSAIQNFINLLNETEKLYIEFKFNADLRFEKNLEITLYRVTTELINNTLKYAYTTRAEVSLNYSEESSTITLEYMDSGKGFDLNEIIKSRKGLGLVNIQQRVNTLNGKIEIKSSAGKGIKVHIELPVEEGKID